LINAFHQKQNQSPEPKTKHSFISQKHSPLSENSSFKFDLCNCPELLSNPLKDIGPQESNIVRSLKFENCEKEIVINEFF